MAMTMTMSVAMEIVGDHFNVILTNCMFAIAKAYITLAIVMNTKKKKK
jgi:hypothetical protein